MGTAAEMMQPGQDEIPFEGFPISTNGRTDHPPSSISSLRHFNPSQPFIIHESLALPSYRFVKNLDGAGYDLTELQQNLYACLQVGRFDRAEALIRRLGERHEEYTTELYAARKQYLAALVNTLVDEQSDAQWKKTQRWFEVEVMADESQLDSEVFALMIRGAFTVLSGLQRDRALRRYLHLAETAGPDLFMDTMACEDFTASELDTLIRLQPGKYQVQPVDQNEWNYGRPMNREQELARKRELDPITLRPVDQKGLGLKTLQKALSPLFGPNEAASALGLEGSVEEQDRLYAQRLQEALEEMAVDSALERWKSEHENMLKMGINTSLAKKSMSALMWEWHCGMTKHVSDQVKRIRELLSSDKVRDRTTTDKRVEWGPYIENISVERLCATTILSIVNSFSDSKRDKMGNSHVLRLGALVSRVGDAIETVGKMAAPEHHGATGRKSRHRTKLLAKLSKEPASLQADASDDQPDMTAVREQMNSRWPQPVKLRIGAFLVSKLIQSARITLTAPNPRTKGTVTASLPAFSHSYRFHDGKKQGLIMAHNHIVRMLTSEPLRGTLGNRLPMIVEPKPWTGFKNGAYYKYPVLVVRKVTADETQLVYTAAAADRGDLDQLFAGLDVLGKTPWKVNERVLKVMAEAWNSGEAVADIPPENPDLPYPPEPDPSEGEAARFEWRHRFREINNTKSGYHSNRSYCNFQLEVANAFRGRQIFFPHNIDFRGRAYPIPAILNHMGADNARGLLQFATGKKLGVVGLRWLKIHLANLYGFDKASFQEREDFASEHIHDIYDSATNPMGGARWWLQAEDPWQCLAVCFELKDAFDCPDPTQHVSFMPVHQDGSCNGLQHYAALGGDTFGAAQVNLEPSDRPRDVYTGVAELVKAELKKDTELKTACDDKQMALFLDGKITRKVVKQTVMTNVYGVTFVGARAQVQKQLKELFPRVNTYPHAGYITKKIFRALSTMFQGAHAIQDWFGVCSERISSSVTPDQIQKLIDTRASKATAKPPRTKGMKKSLTPAASEDEIMQFKSTVVWTTPLKVPVVQPYRKPRTRTVQTDLQLFRFNVPTKGDPVIKRKQAQAFPPNFIHSLDATHMLLSALKSHELGLTFAAVHDSFWTHAADVPTINRVLRDAFIRMHQEDVIGRLKAEFEARYQGCMTLVTVFADSEVGKRVYAWRKKNAKPSKEASYDELLMEHKRQTMLQSEDPAEVEQARDMVTPGSIYATATEAEVTRSGSEEASVARLGDMYATSHEGQAASSPDADGGDHSDLAAAADHAEDDTGAVADDSEPASTTTTDEPEAEDELAIPDETDHMAREAAARKRRAAKRKSARPKLRLWLPLTIPDVPHKGSFDVSRLKESAYFFS